MSVDVLDSLRIVVRNGHDLGFEKLAAAGDMVAVNVGDLLLLQSAATRGADEIIKLRSENARYSATIDRAMQTLDMATDGIEQLKRHRDDLLEANNRYLERARAAETEIMRRDEKTEDTKQRVQQILRDKVTSSSDLAETIGALGKFIDMIEARAMAVDGPVTPFCEELHAASDLEKSQFQAILSKLYQFRNAWVKNPLVAPKLVERLKKKPLVTPEWVQKKAALEDGHDPTTGKPFDPNWPKAWKTVAEVFHELGYLDIERYEDSAVISSIAGNADSLDFVEMLIELEKCSGHLIDESELPHFKICTIGDVVGLLAAKMAKAGAA